MITFDKIVKKLLKYENSILNIKDIWEIIDPDFSSWNKKHIAEIYKTIYRLKSNNLIFPIKSWLYYINYDKNVRKIDIIDNNYWKIIKKIIIDETAWDYIIWWDKSLEVHLKDYSIHNTLIVYTKNINKTIGISWNLRVKFIILKAWKKNSNKYNFNYLHKFSQKTSINGIDFCIAWEEFSILDSLIINNIKNWIDNYQIAKFLKKYSNYLDRDILWALVKYRYISSINRLRIISKNNDNVYLYKICLDIIKKEWANCFLTLK